MTITYFQQILRGHVYKVGGEIVVDTCATPGEHMAAPTLPGDDRRVCRKHLNDVFEEFVGRKGTIMISVDFEEESL